MSTACEACGVVPEPLLIRANGNRRAYLKSQVRLHHWDYSKPDDVIPLCNKCHSAVHHGHIPEPRTGRIYVSPGTLAARARRERRREDRERAPRALREFAAQHTITRVNIGAKP